MSRSQTLTVPLHTLIELANRSALMSAPDRYYSDVLKEVRIQLVNATRCYL
jgi:hypothetical protein